MAVEPDYIDEARGVTLYCGDCRDVLGSMGDGSVASVVTDPPYGLSFMGKAWDYAVPRVDVWRECLRVLKPGGHLLAFAGTRTQHRMAVNIEDAGFEIRDMIAWVYGSGMPKAFNLARIPACQCDGSTVSYSHENESYINAPAEHEMPSLREADLPPAEPNSEECNDSVFPFLLESNEGSVIPPYGESNTKKSGEDDRRCKPGVEGGPLHGTSEGIYDGSQSRPSTGEGERIRSGTHSGNGEETRETTCPRGRSTPYQSRQGGQSAGESTTISQPPGTLGNGTYRGRAQCPRCGGLKKEWTGFSSALKPSMEPITVARKPFACTVAANVLEHGTGALNIDGCRVGTEETGERNHKCAVYEGVADGYKRPNKSSYTHKTDWKMQPSGRWPANLIHDGSDEVLGLFPQTKGGSGKPRVEKTGDSTISKTGGLGIEGGRPVGFETAQYGDSGSAARFFYCAKASKADRDEENNHATVKPVDLMRYLCRLVTPPGGTVLDPFMGSGTTGLAAVHERFSFVGIEIDPKYFEIARDRIDRELRQGVLF